MGKESRCGALAHAPLRALAIAADSGKIGTFRPAWRYGQAIDDRSAPVAFLERLLLHYKVYRGYPLPPWPAFKNAWRIAFR